MVVSVNIILFNFIQQTYDGSPLIREDEDTMSYQIFTYYYYEHNILHN